MYLINLCVFLFHSRFTTTTFFHRKMNENNWIKIKAREIIVFIGISLSYGIKNTKERQMLNIIWY